MREALGELTLVTSEQMTTAVPEVDKVSEINPTDRRQLFYEQMKDFFFALRDIHSDEIDDATLDLLVRQGRGVNGGVALNLLEAQKEGKISIKNFYMTSLPCQHSLK